MHYEDFIKSKEHSTNNYGFEAKWFPKDAFDFQEHIIQKEVQAREFVLMQTKLQSLIESVVNILSKAPKYRWLSHIFIAYIGCKLRCKL